MPFPHPLLMASNWLVEPKDKNAFNEESMLVSIEVILLYKTQSFSWEASVSTHLSIYFLRIVCMILRFSELTFSYRHAHNQSSSFLVASNASKSFTNLVSLKNTLFLNNKVVHPAISLTPPILAGSTRIVADARPNLSF